MPPSPKRKPQTLRELKELQRLTASAIFRPLTPDDQMQPTWTDGRATRTVVEQFIKPNDRLTAFERLEIYNRQYWFRLIDILYDDCPGLRAVVGEEKFNALIRAYLAKYPSRTFSLRELGRALPQFIEDEPHWAAPRAKMALDMARFEWAQTLAFDERALPALAVDDLLGQDPATLRLAIQPYISLLEMDYPHDRFSVVVRRNALRSDASNAAEMDRQTKAKRQIPLPRKAKSFVAVHRYRNALYYKRLDPPAFALLTALAEGQPLADAISTALEKYPDPRWTRKIKIWFETWTSLGWFCRAGT